MTLGEKTPLVRTFLGEGAALMPAWDAVVGLVLSASAMILLVLTAVRYRDSRGMRLGVSCLLVASSAFRLTRGLMTGVGVSWVDAAALVFFGYSAIAEAIPFIRSRYPRKSD